MIKPSSWIFWRLQRLPSDKDIGKKRRPLRHSNTLMTVIRKIISNSYPTTKIIKLIKKSNFQTPFCRKWNHWWTFKQQYCKISIIMLCKITTHSLIATSTLYWNAKYKIKIVARSLNFWFLKKISKSYIKICNCYAFWNLYKQREGTRDGDQNRVVLRFAE